VQPAALYLISSWYKRYETQKRIAFWFIGGAVIAGFNGILSYGLSRMEGVGGLRGWRWIFIIPGLVTIATAVPFYLIITDFPEKAKWLNEQQRAWFQQRLMDDRAESEETLQRKHLLEAAKDWKIWMMGSLLCFPTAGGYTMAFFTPTILKGFGYNTAYSQCLVTPPYIAAAICSFIIGIWADRVRRRGPFIIGLCLMVIVGFLLIGWGPNNGSRLVGIFLGIIGNYCAIPSAITFLLNNTPGAAKRQIAVAIQTTLGGIGGIIGSLIFRTQDAPRFRPGLYASFTCMLITMAFTSFLMWHFRRENKKADEEGKILEGRPSFRYTL
jgi:MFS family permease